MKLLLIDTDDELISLFEFLNENNHFSIDFCESLESCPTYFNTNEYDIVLVNFTMPHGMDILNYIQKQNPKQRIITLSEELVYSEPKGEHYCQEHYNKRRLLKPISIKDLVETIKNFDSTPCKYVGKFGCTSGLITILSDLLRRFKSVEYDVNTKTIHINYPSDIINVTHFLQTNNIPYEVKDNKITII